MARYPNARWRPVQGLAADPAIKPIGVILHVSGSEATSLHDYFDGPSGGIESHLHIARDGTVEQYRDTEREADANYRGNSWWQGDDRLGFLSVETQGGAAGEWTARQVEEIKRFLTWASTTHGFPLRVAPSYHSPGVGWHVMWGAGPGTDSWSNAKGKVCPGPDRIRQFHTELIPWMARPATPAAATAATSTPARTTQEDDDVTPQDKEDIAALVVKKLLATDLGKPGGGDTVAVALQSGFANTVAIKKNLGA